ncbi:MAG: hypothetical protein KF691_06680 [Phycisphaeraceae bacterium]|nr:hypothetical protein [Phycisphaeraceae bacterium]
MARISANWSSTSRTTVSGDWYEQFYPHPSMVFGHKTLAIDRLDAPALSWDNGVGSIFETRRLVPGAKLIAYARNRTFDIDTGRWLQQDPNASGVTLLSGTAYHGAVADAMAGEYSVRFLHQKIKDMGLTTGLRGKPIALAKVHYALQNPFYCGVMRYGGELFDGAHQSMGPTSH